MLQEASGEQLGIQFASILEPISLQNPALETFGMLPAGLRESLQQYCKTAVLQVCAGPATGAQRHLD